MARPPKQDRAAIRSKRVSLALIPATREKLTALADRKSCSVNDFVANLLEKFFAQDDSFIEEFTADFKPVWKKKTAQPST